MKKSIILLTILSLCSAACKGKETSNPLEDVSGGKTTKQLLNLESNNAPGSTVLSKIPNDIDGFVHFNLTSPAYNKFSKSQYAEKADPKAVQQIRKNFSDILFGLDIHSLFNQVGLDWSKTSDATKFYSDNVFFFKVSESKKIKDGASPIIGGLLFESKIKEVDKFWKAAVSELTQKEAPIEEITKDSLYKISESIEFDVPQTPLGAKNPLPGLPGQDQIRKIKIANEAFLTWKDNYSLISSSVDFNKNFINNYSKSQNSKSQHSKTQNSKTQPLPKIFESPSFKEATSGFSEPSSQLFLAFADLNILSSLSNSDEQPFQSVAFQTSMKNAPFTNLKVLYKDAVYKDTASESYKELINLKGTDFSKALSMVSSEPLAILNLDPNIINAYIKRSNTKLPSQHMSSISLVIGSKLTQGGIFQLPGINLNMEAKDEKSLGLMQNELKELVKFLLNLGSATRPQQNLASQGATSPAATQTQKIDWEIRKLENGSSYDVISSPMGVTINLLSKDGFLILSTDENSIKTLLTEDPSKASKNKFITTASKDVKAFISQRPQISSIYFDNTKFAETLESLSGLLNMFAPQNKQAQEFLKPENIARLKTLGKVVVSVENNSESLFIKQTYY